MSADTAAAAQLAFLNAETRGEFGDLHQSRLSQEPIR